MSALDLSVIKPEKDDNFFAGLLRKYWIKPLKNHFEKIDQYCGKNPGRFFFFIWPDAIDVMRHIEDHILRGNGEKPMQIKRQYLEDCTMISLAAAIVAQIAVTALSLDHLDESRWTAKASFIISLVTALLAVYFACRVEQKMTNLLSVEDVRNFLSTQLSPKDIIKVDNVAREFERLRDEEKRIKPEEKLARMDELEILLAELDDKSRWHKASIWAAMMIKVPGLLVNASLSSLIIGMGIYLQDLTHPGPDRPLAGSPSMKVFICYLVFVGVGSVIYVVPWGCKRFEMLYARHWDEHKKREDTAAIWKAEVFRARQKQSITDDLGNAKKMAAEIKLDYEAKIKRSREAAIQELIKDPSENGDLGKESSSGSAPA